jgi:hypothetical protein
MSVSQEALIRFVYGELSAEEACDVARALERDPVLRALVEEQRKVRAGLESAPEIQPAPASPGTVGSVSPAAGRGRNLVAGAAMLGGLALGVLLAASFGLGSEIGYERGALIANGTLADALSTAASGTVRSGVRIVSSFWSTRDSFCRSFVMSRGRARGFAGVACREAGVWRITATAELALGAAEGNVSGESDLPPAIRSAVAAIIAGEPLDQDAERAARGQDWRVR